MDIFHPDSRSGPRVPARARGTEFRVGRPAAGIEPEGSTVKNPDDRWGLLIASLPARPLYLRARVRRRLEEAGAAPLRKAVYALKSSPAALDRLRDVAREIEAGGGSALVCEATFPDTATASAVVRAFNDEIARRYRAWSAAAARALGGAAPSGGRAGSPRQVAALARRLERIAAADRFGAPGGAEARALLDRAPGAAAARGADLRGRRWVTRRGVHVDRIACAWVVRRFIDPRATFRFTADPAAPLARNEIGFDMPHAAIAHERGGCSMETLIARAGLDDPRLRYVAEIVHDVDIKDARHRHPETAGFEQLLIGMLTSTPADHDRLEQGLRLFDALYAAPLPGAAASAAASAASAGEGAAKSTTRQAPPPIPRVPPALQRRKPR